MDGYEIELVGGPADGEVRTLSTDRRELKFITPLNLSPEFIDETMGPPAEAHIEMIEVVYLRSRQINQRGQRIYHYRK
jgi:hypothetical protein